MKEATAIFRGLILCGLMNTKSLEKYVSSIFSVEDRAFHAFVSFDLEGGVKVLFVNLRFHVPVCEVFCNKEGDSTEEQF